MSAETIYVRRDDPLEKVKIVSQERTPNGKIVFEFVEPESAAGRTYNYPANEFHALYEDPNKVEEEKGDPPRPSSMATKEDWRRYALWLEERYHRPKPPVYRGDRPFGPTIPTPVTPVYRNLGAGPHIGTDDGGEDPDA